MSDYRLLGIERSASRVTINVLSEGSAEPTAIHGADWFSAVVGHSAPSDQPRGASRDPGPGVGIRAAVTGPTDAGGSIRCEVWWASPADASPGLVDLVPEAERIRIARLHRSADRGRALVGAALARLALGRQLGVDPTAVELARRCRCGSEHGKPRLVSGGGLDVSVSHSGPHIVVALVRGAEVGVDVEADDRRAGPPAPALLRLATTPAERGAWQHGWSRTEFLRTWVRKESVVKATGDGLSVPFAGFTVTAPGDAPALLSWPADPGLPARVALADLPARAGATATVAVLAPVGTTTAPTALAVVEHDASLLLAQA